MKSVGGPILFVLGVVALAYASVYYGLGRLPGPGRVEVRGELADEFLGGLLDGQLPHGLVGGVTGLAAGCHRGASSS